MDEVNSLKEQVEILEIKLDDANNKLNLNKQYSLSLEMKIKELNEIKPINYNISIILLLVVIIVFLLKKILVLSKCKQSIKKCDSLYMR